VNSKIESSINYLKQRKDYFVVIAGQSTAKLLMLVMFIILPAMIGVAEWGTFSLALYICFVFSQPLVDYGLDPIVIKYISRGYDYLIKNAFLLKLKTSFIGLLLAITAAFVLGAKVDIVILIFLYLFFLSLSNTIFSYFRGKQKFIYESILLPLSRAISIIFIFLLSKILLVNNSYTGAIPFAISTFLLFFLALVFFLKNYRNVDIMNKTDDAKENSISLFKEGSFIFLSALLTTVYFRVDGVILGSMIGKEELGIYSLAYRLYEGSIIIPGAIMMVIFPRISAMDKEKLRKYFKKWITILFLAAIGAFIILYFGGGFLINRFYSVEFSRSIIILRYLALSVLTVFPAHLTTQILIARDKNKLFLITTVSGAIFNLLLNLILIPIMKSYGAVLTHILTEAMVFILSFVLAKWTLKKGL
jgi:O-antigen/teichoic acid export membrane protein